MLILTNESADRRPYRAKTNVIVVSRGMVYGGTFTDDGTFGLFGGGIEEGEDALEAASREFTEETGLAATDLVMLPVKSVKIEWRPPYLTPKLAERAKHFRGSEVFFVGGRLVEGFKQKRAKGDDGTSWLRDVRFYSLDEIKRMNARPVSGELIEVKRTIPVACELAIKHFR